MALGHVRVAIADRPDTGNRIPLPREESPARMARAALLLATEPPEKISGCVTYSPQIPRVRLDHPMRAAGTSRRAAADSRRSSGRTMRHAD